MRMLVCGGRNYNDWQQLDATLSQIKQTQGWDDDPIELVIHGGAQGADEMAGEWANDHDVETLVFPADWQTYGRQAGMIRNQQMLDEGQPDLVVAFPGGRGTANMVQRAEEAGVPVITIDPLPL